MIWLSRLNLSAGYWDFFWPQVIQGMAMSMLFVPLTTIAMDAIPREKMGYATSLFSLMRNIGGSIGIAVTSTMLSRHTQQTTSLYGANVTAMDATTQSLFLQMRGAFMAAGSDIVTATDRAYAALFGMVQRQASIVSFVGLFQLLGNRLHHGDPAGAADEAAAGGSRRRRRGALRRKAPCRGRRVLTPPVVR